MGTIQCVNLFYELLCNIITWHIIKIKINFPPHRNFSARPIGCTGIFRPKSESPSITTNPFGKPSFPSRLQLY